MFDVARSLTAGPVPSHPPGLNFEGMGGWEGEEKGQVGMKRRKTSTMNACALRAKPFTSLHLFPIFPPCIQLRLLSLGSEGWLRRGQR
uniref:Uncharacterized protein n=1 Tax=Echinococcus canadensis TaxID=519352 RepID=A0A915EXK3_9CEST